MYIIWKCSDRNGYAHMKLFRNYLAEEVDIIIYVVKLNEINLCRLLYMVYVLQIIWSCIYVVIILYILFTERIKSVFFFYLPGSSDKALPKSTRMLNSIQAPKNSFMVIVSRSHLFSVEKILFSWRWDWSRKIRWKNVA